MQYRENSRDTLYTNRCITYYTLYFVDIPVYQNFNIIEKLILNPYRVIKRDDFDFPSYSLFSIFK